MMMKYFMPLMAVLVLMGCAATPPVKQKAQKAKPSAPRSLDMEQICRAEAAHRYNTGPGKISVMGFEQFQATYEMRGYTSRKEGFVCSFDPEGQFLHLSMR